MITQLHMSTPLISHNETSPEKKIQKRKHTAAGIH